MTQYREERYFKKGEVNQQHASETIAPWPLVPTPTLPLHACRASPERPLSFLPHLSQFYPKKRRHTELCFISWFRNQKKFLDKMLSPGEKYRVTWYMSWSPCINCANAVVRFLEENENADWRIFVARLYYSNSPEHRLGLRRLHHAGVQMNIMSSEDFEYCWETFVDHQGTPFFPWDDMDENYERLSMTLEDILQNQEN